MTVGFGERVPLATGTTEGDCGLWELLSYQCLTPSQPVRLSQGDRLLEKGSFCCWDHRG